MKKSAFTIVELLVVIVVIGILATITIVSYTGVTQKAMTASLQSDLINVSKLLKIDQITNMSYPATLAEANGGKGVPSSSGTTYQYAADNLINPQSFCLTATKDTYSYNIDSYDIMKFGGKNTVKFSDALKSSGTSATGITKSTTSEGYLQVISVAGNGNWLNGFITDYSGIEDHFNEGDDVVVTFEMKSPDHTSIPRFYFKPYMGYYNLQGNMSSEFSTVWLTTKWKKAELLSFHLGWGTVVGTTIIKNMKISKGTVPTCWTPAT